MPGVITINPSVFGDKRDAMAVAVNEALRLFIEDTKFVPKFEVTEEQRRLFRGTAYADDDGAMRRTITARVATFDTSVKPTPDQVSETRRLLGLVMEAIGERHQDFPLVQKIDELLGANKDMNSASVQTPAQSEGTAQDDMLGGDVSMSPSVTGQVFANSPIVPEAESVAIPATKVASPRDSTVTKVLNALLQVESEGDPNAIGDQGRAVGAYQLWKIRVDEANRLAKKEVWSYEDRKDPQLSRAMAKIFLEHHYKRGVTDPVELGSLWRNPNPKKEPAPEWYRAKLRKALRDQ